MPSMRIENDGKQPLLVVHEQLAGHGAPRRNVLRHQEIQFQRGQAEPADQPRDQQGGEHGGQDEEEQVIGRDHRAEPDHQDGEGEQQPAVGDAVA